MLWTFESIDLERPVLVRTTQNLWLSFIYQGHRIKVKVTGEKSVFVCPVRGWSALWLKDNLVVIISLKLTLLIVFSLRAVNRCEPVPRIRHAVAESQLAVKDSVVNYTCIEGFVASALSAMSTVCDGTHWTSIVTRCEGRRSRRRLFDYCYISCLRQIGLYQLVLRLIVSMNSIVDKLC